MAKTERHRLTEADRLQKYFWDLEKLIPEPPRNWAVNAKPCKWKKLLEEKDKSGKSNT